MSDDMKQSLAPPKGRPGDTDKMEVVSPFTVLNDMLTHDPEKIPESNVKHPASFDLQKVLTDPTIRIDAQVMECDPAGRYRLVTHDKRSLYSDLKDAPVITAAPERQITFREALAEKYPMTSLREDFGLDTISSTASEPFANFTPLFMGPYYRNQFMFKLLEAKSKCYEAWVNNPVAHRIPSLITQFTLGKGVTISCKSDKTRKVWDAFAKLNKIGTSMNVGLTRAGSRLRMWSNQLSVDGEVMLQFIPKRDGLHLKCLDSATVLDVVTDPEDIDKVH